jgi:hypothetical protein
MFSIAQTIPSIHTQIPQTFSINYIYKYIVIFVIGMKKTLDKESFWPSLNIIVNKEVS